MLTPLAPAIVPASLRTTAVATTSLTMTFVPVIIVATVIPITPSSVPVAAFITAVVPTTWGASTGLTLNVRSVRACYVDCLLSAILRGLNEKLDLFTLGQATKTFCTDLRLVHKQIDPILRCDEAVALLGIEPFAGSPRAVRSTHFVVKWGGQLRSCMLCLLFYESRQRRSIRAE